MENEFVDEGRDHWTEMDVRDLMSELRRGFSIEEAARHLRRLGTVDEVRRKAEELGLKYHSDKRNG
jgi:hypothetical protein